MGGEGEGVGKGGGLTDSPPRAPFVLRALFSVRATFTIHVAVTILGRCLLMERLFQIISDGLFVSDNIRFI